MQFEVPATNWDAPGIIFLKLLAIVFLVLLNGFFVASEFATAKARDGGAKNPSSGPINTFREIENTFSRPSGASGSDYYNA
jgi:hypothetical protein